MFLAFCRDRFRYLLLYLVTVFLFCSICALNRLDILEKLLYAVAVVTFVWLVTGVLDFYKYAATYRLLYETAVNWDDSQIFLPEPGSMPEMLYQNLIRAERERHQETVTAAMVERTDLNDYYVLWAHQIKTPIAAMKLLIEGQDGEMTAGNKYALWEELFKTEQYVDMALHYLKVNSISSDLLLKEYELHGLVSRAVKKFSILFINRKLTFRLEDFNCMVLTDELWLTFVIEQVISNAIKYTKSGTISIYRKKNGDKTLVIEDEGMGIRPEDLPRIFDRGFTGYNGRMDKKSTGIGLYLCKKIMGKLRSGIHVESQPSRGTCVYLHLGREESGEKNEEIS